MFPMTGVIRPYPWGSRTVLAGMTGRPVPSRGPEAELWLGAHPAAPSYLPGGDLIELINEDPVGTLGERVFAEFGPRLPYLLKVLAADAPLSIQAHPDPVRAAAAFAASYPGYTDPYHKPELLVALTPFSALCGFSTPETAADRIAALGITAFLPLIRLLRSPSAAADRLSRALSVLLNWPIIDRGEIVSALSSGPDLVAADLARRHPGDMGAAVSLLLNHVELAPGEAIWMPAGNLHAYLSGAGVEVMAASDNVVRGGLTDKRVDVAELMRILRFEALAEPVFPASSDNTGVRSWKVPAADFVLRQAAVDAVDGTEVFLPADGPRILVCVNGSVVVSTGSDRSELSSGGSVFVPARADKVRVSGCGMVFQAGAAL